jgi:hypothetical protein
MRIHKTADKLAVVRANRGIPDRNFDDGFAVFLGLNCFFFTQDNANIQTSTYSGASPLFTMFTHSSIKNTVFSDIQSF